MCRISDGEKEMIMEERSYDPAARAEELATPALKLVSAFLQHPSFQVWHMVRSPAVLVVMATDFCCGWGNACIISMTPMFMKVVKTVFKSYLILLFYFPQDVLDFDIQGNGLTSAMPHLARAVVGNVCNTIQQLTRYSAV